MDIRRMLFQRNEENLRAMELFARLLQSDAPLFSSQEVLAFAEDTRLPQQDAFLTLLSAACGLETDRIPFHKTLEKEYLRPALNGLRTEDFLRNDYLSRIRFPEAKQGDWEFTHLTCAPYQLFPCGESRLTAQGRVIPGIGYFTEEWAYPAVLEGGREWMAVKPNEIFTMAEPLRSAHGSVAAFGLGLGYFALAASIKENVSSVTVVERDKHAISLFSKLLLPQFPHPEKIRIIQEDAFAFAEKRLTPSAYDFAFFDLWHDVSDGLPQYLKLRKITSPLIECSYWIEDEMLLFLRGLFIDDLQNDAGKLDALLPKDDGQLEDALSLPGLRGLAPKIQIDQLL